MNIIILKKALNDLLIEMPYNSISHLYQYFTSTTPDSRFGAACAWQTIELANRLKSLGAEELFFVRDHRHGALITACHGRLFLLDPYLMHIEPISLSKLFQSKLGLEFIAYPMCQIRGISKQVSILHARFYAKRGVLSLKYKRLNLLTEEYQISHKFKFNLNQRLITRPSDDEIIHLFFDPEQNNLSIRAINPIDKRVSQLIYPICLYHGDNLISEKRLVLKTNEGAIIKHQNKAVFENEVNKMCIGLRCSREELISFILGGVEIYEKHAPSRIAYLPLDSVILECVGHGKLCNTTKRKYKGQQDSLTINS